MAKLVLLLLLESSPAIGLWQPLHGSSTPAKRLVPQRTPPSPPPLPGGARPRLRLCARQAYVRHPGLGRLVLAGALHVELAAHNKWGGKGAEGRTGRGQAGAL